MRSARPRIALPTSEHPAADPADIELRRPLLMNTVVHGPRRPRAGWAVLAVLVVAGALAPAAHAIDPAVEARLTRVERMLSEQSLSDLVLQIQQLQQEVQELRGQVEMQQYTLQQLRGSRFGGAPQFGAERQPTPFGEPRIPYLPGQNASGGGPTPDQDSRMPGSQGSLPSTPGSATPALPPPQQGLGAEGRGRSIPSSGLLGLPSPETTAGGEREAYREAFDLLKERDYDGAKEEFVDLLSSYPQGQFADNARYWLGEIGYVTEDYGSAQAQFNRLITDYPLSPKVPGAMLKLGYIYASQGDTEQSRQVLQDIIVRFPDSTESRLAQGRLEQMERGER